MKKMIFYIVFLAPLLIYSQSTDDNTLSSTSKKIPNLLSPLSLLEKLDSTVWTTSDLRRGEDLFVFFKKDTQGISVAKHGTKVTIPKIMYPIKFIQNGTEANSGIFIVPSKEKILYYSFYLISPYYLAISAGYDNITPLTNITIQNYFSDGYFLQLVY